MQKKIIALAVAGLVSGVAFAQSNVTIYGVADVGIEAGKYSDKGMQTRVQSGQSAGSRIGFKGEEALGNGLKAMFVMEAGVSMDTGNTSHGGSGTDGATASPLFGRQAFAGLSSDKLGTVTFGRQYTTAYNTLVKADAFGYGLNAQLGNTVAKTTAAGSRWDNAVFYKSPSFAGFSATAGYTSGAATGAEVATANSSAAVLTQNGRGVTVAGAYENGPIYAGLAYVEVDTLGTATAAPAGNMGKSKAAQFGASYDFKVVKLFGSYAQGKNTIDQSTADAAKNNGWSLGVKAPFGNHAVMAQYSKLNDKTAANADYSVWGAGYEYSLSKRTALYAAYAKGDNKNGASYGLDGAASGTSAIGSTAQAGYNPWNVMTGVRHSF
jgi:GBP family porin